MLSETENTQPSRKSLWIGRVLGWFAILFLVFDAAIKILRLPFVLQSFRELGYPESVSLGIGIVLLACVVLYAIPRTSVLGAVLLTGYLGGATATHVRLMNPWPSHILFPSYVAALLWGSLLLQIPRLRTLLPLKD